MYHFRDISTYSEQCKTNRSWHRRLRVCQNFQMTAMPPCQRGLTGAMLVGQSPSILIPVCGGCLKCHVKISSCLMLVSHSRKNCPTVSNASFSQLTCVQALGISTLSSSQIALPSFCFSRPLVSLPCHKPTRQRWP